MLWLEVFLLFAWGVLAVAVLRLSHRVGVIERAAEDLQDDVYAIMEDYDDGWDDDLPSF